MESRKRQKSHLRLSDRRRKQSNILKFNAARRADLPCLTKRILEAGEHSVTEKHAEVIDGSGEDDLQPDQETSPVRIRADNESASSSDSREFGDRIDKENIEPVTSSQLMSNRRSIKTEGYRIVNFQKLLDRLKKISNHSPFGCNFSNLHIISEHRKGFISKFTFECDMCGLIEHVSTCPEDPSELDINTAAVAGIMNTGGGYTQLKSLTAAMEIPSFSFNFYKKMHTEVCEAWEKTAWQSMREAAAEESKMAIDCGSVDKNGTPMITVVCDGSWAKRSYRGGGNYNSLSGVAAIVGLKTGKILYLGVKNKYCCVCQRGLNKGEAVPPHTCYKNWNSTSTSMESAIISEGFCQSLQMYNLIYNKMIGDGDSSCYKQIIDSKPYNTCTVQKIECRNHLLRNYCNKLREQTKAKGVPGTIKNVISNNILRARSAVMKAIKYRQSETDKTEEQKIIGLRQDILNSISHIFGEHKNCSSLQYFCSKTEPDANNYVTELKLFGVEEKIMEAVRYLAGHSRSLLENVDTNVVEQFNAMIAQKTGGKRINFTMRGCYQGRCYAAVVSKNTHRPLYSCYKYLTGGRSPGKILKKHEERAKHHSEMKRTKKCKRKLTFPKIKKGEQDSNYGEHCQKPDMDATTYESLKITFLDELKKTKEEYEELEERTRLQADCAEWQHTRKNLLTASNFGKICRMRPSTSCISTVESLLYKHFFSKATAWGKNNEERAKRKLEIQCGSKISDCGIFVNERWPFLGASPDGVTEDNCLVEIKCPYSSRNLTVKEAVSQRLINYLVDVGDGQFTLKKNHNYYYQVQGQLNICTRNTCYFAVWTLKDAIFIKIDIDQDFFQNTMVPKLERFYSDCLLPEIIDPRHTRGMKIRDPVSIVDAKNKPDKKSKTPKK